MAENVPAKKRAFSADWFVQGVLTRLGDTFDRFTGRGWKPSSSLATSELAERLKGMIDGEAREVADKRKFVPHHIALKMQWDKFSTDSDAALKKLENELLVALVDHINDRRYFTYAPLSLTVKPDYFISGVKLLASFDDPSDDEREAAVNVTVPDLAIDLENTGAPSGSVDIELKLLFRSEIGGKTVERVVELKSGERLSVGRTKENDIALDDVSVSKLHASLLLDRDGQMVAADTGSTNGTFIDGERIAYGKAVPFRPEQQLRFGTVNVAFEVISRRAPAAVPQKDEAVHQQATSSYRVGEFEFSQKVTGQQVDIGPAAPTMPSLPGQASRVLKPLVEAAATERGTAVDKRETEGNT